MNYLPQLFPFLVLLGRKFKFINTSQSMFLCTIVNGPPRGARYGLVRSNMFIASTVRFSLIIGSQEMSGMLIRDGRQGFFMLIMPYSIEHMHGVFSLGFVGGECREIDPP